MKKLLLAVALVLSGCISKGEYKKFVEATRAYYDEVTPTYRSSVQSDPGLSEQSRTNRLGLADDYAAALIEAEERAGLRDEAADAATVDSED